MIAKVPDVTILFRPAERIVHAAMKPDFDHAVLYEADGSTAGARPAISATGIVRWTFVFDNFGSKDRYASASVSYTSARGFGRVAGHVDPVLEDVPIPKPPRLTLAQAVARLRHAGYDQKFTAVTLRNPLGPKRTNPYYIFLLASGHFLAVDTVTKKISHFG